MTNKHDVDVNGGPTYKSPALSRSPKHNRRHTHSYWGECRYRLTGLLAKHGQLSYDGAKRISFGTTRSRSFVLMQGFAYLNQIDMCPRKPENFKPKHFAKLVQHWEEQGLAPATLQLRFSVFSAFCTWIGKAGMLGDVTRYLKNPDAAKRIYVAKQDKSWSAKGVDVQAKIREVAAIHPHAAIALKVMDAFGVRLQEAVSLCPKEADWGGYLYVAWGTKGGRKRPVRIESDYQRQVLEEAKRYANSSTGSLVPDTFKRRSWIRYVYRIFNACGIGRKHGIIPHGLRHQRANDKYENLTGQKSPVRGGGSPTDQNTDKRARLVVAEDLGHSRHQITGMYIGPMPKGNKKEVIS